MRKWYILAAISVVFMIFDPYMEIAVGDYARMQFNAIPSLLYDAAKILLCAFPAFVRITLAPTGRLAVVLYAVLLSVSAVVFGVFLAQNIAFSIPAVFAAAESVYMLCLAAVKSK
ncbi:MAG: hypothetical protein IKU17_08320 [Clostridia bacterium]|nr:hypothetical protein [Clostridia bacterium]